MTTETSISKPNPVFKAVPSETKPPEAGTCAGIHADRPVGAEKKAAGVGAAVPRLGDLQLMLEELKSSDSVRRAAAAAALGRTADNAAVPGLIAALDDSDADVARQAAKSLGSLGNAAAVDPLVAVVNNREGYFHSAVRIAAIHSLGELRDLRAVVPLLNAIRDPLADASAEAIRALSLLPDPRGVPALLEVVRNENGFFLATTRRAAILGLAHIGGKQALCELRFVASNQWEDATVRAAALEAAPPGSNLVAGA